MTRMAGYYWAAWKDPEPYQRDDIFIVQIEPDGYCSVCDSDYSFQENEFVFLSGRLESPVKVKL